MNQTATSLEALDTVTPRIPSIKERIMNVVRDQNGIGVTREDLIAQTGIHQNSISGRITELKDAGKIAVKGTRVNARGNHEDVYVLGDGIHRVKAKTVTFTEERFVEILRSLRSDDVNGYLGRAFVWADSPEGYEFWRNLNDQVNA